MTGFFQGGRNKSRAGDQDQVESWMDVRDQSPHHFAQETFGTVPINRCSHRSPRGDTDFYTRLVMRLHYQHNKRVGIGLARTPHPLEVFGAGQTEFSLHPYPLTCSMESPLTSGLS